MNITIQAKGLELTGGLREHVERRLNFALDRAHYHIDKVSVRLSDQNGPRGGEDKRCQVVVHLDGSAPVLVEHTEADLLLAIDRAADRTGQTLARQLDRRREHRRETHRGSHLTTGDSHATAAADRQAAIFHHATGERHAHHA